MSRLVWGAVGERFYETGVDRGVLYIDEVGIAWNGLVSVAESPSGGEPKPHYLDGVKYLNRSAGEEFEATIEAYTYPEEFAQCDGTDFLGNGLYATQHRRRPFDFSYRTLIGNDVNGSDHGYKIHLVYGAKVAPSQRANATLGEETDPDNFSWAVTTTPPVFTGRKPTSHFIIDSRSTPPDLLELIEDILYGDETTNPRIPTVDELIFLMVTHNDTNYDAGLPSTPAYYTHDAGFITEPATLTLDGGGP